MHATLIQAKLVRCVAVQLVLLRREGTVGMVTVETVRWISQSFLCTDEHFSELSMGLARNHWHTVGCGRRAACRVPEGHRARLEHAAPPAAAHTERGTVGVRWGARLTMRPPEILDLPPRGATRKDEVSEVWTDIY